MNYRPSTVIYLPFSTHTHRARSTLIRFIAYFQDNSLFPSPTSRAAHIRSSGSRLPSPSITPSTPAVLRIQGACTRVYIYIYTAATAFSEIAKFAVLHHLPPLRSRPSARVRYIGTESPRALCIYLYARARG